MRNEELSFGIGNWWGRSFGESNVDETFLRLVLMETDWVQPWSSDWHETCGGQRWILGCLVKLVTSRCAGWREISRNQAVAADQSNVTGSWVVKWGTFL